jgi:hypothetical protein
MSVACLPACLPTCNIACNNLGENQVGDPHSDGAWLWDNYMEQTSLSNDSHSLLPSKK